MLIAGKIIDYLEAQEKSVNDDVLRETVQRMRQVMVRDLMAPRDTRAGKESNTLYTGACARKARLTYDGAARDPLRARTVLKFLLGDLVELSVLAMARLAGCDIKDNNVDLTVKGEDGVLVPVHPDGRHEDDRCVQRNVEIKSCDSRTFDAWLDQGGPDDTWGYLTQASMEIQAWREEGIPMNETIFVAVSTGSRQGSIAEWIMPYDEQLVIRWHERRLAVQQETVPSIPFEAQPEMAFMRGKACEADWFAHGEPMPRVNEKGATYGWDIYTGRCVVPLVCSYCDFRTKHCWTNAVLEVDGTKPIWVVPARQLASDDKAAADGAGEPAKTGTIPPVNHDVPVRDDVFASTSARVDHETAISDIRTVEEGQVVWDAVVKDARLSSQDKAVLYQQYQRQMKNVSKQK